MTTGVTMDQAIELISSELKEQLEKFRSENKLVEAQRLEQRTNYDIEMLVKSVMSAGSRITPASSMAGLPGPVLIR